MLHILHILPQTFSFGIKKKDISNLFRDLELRSMTPQEAPCLEPSASFCGLQLVLYIKQVGGFSCFVFSHFFFFKSVSVFYCIWPQTVGSSFITVNDLIWLCLKVLLTTYVIGSGCQINEILFPLASTVIL